jgi:hypothetical protein
VHINDKVLGLRKERRGALFSRSWSNADDRLNSKRRLSCTGAEVEGPKGEKTWTVENILQSY